MSAPKMPGLTHAEQKALERRIEDAIAEFRCERGGGDAVDAGAADWALRYATRAGLLDDPRLVVRAVRKRR